jgi:hypothetical protein
MLAVVQRKWRRRLEWELERRSEEFLIIALAPRTVKALRPSAFLGPRGVLAVVAIKTLLYASGPWLVPRLHRWALNVDSKRAVAVECLSRELGREPTDEELYRAMASARRSRRAAPWHRDQFVDRRYFAS